MHYKNNIELELRKFVAPEYVFGLNARKKASNYLLKLGAERVLLCTDKGLGKTPWLAELEDSLIEESIEYVVFDDISPNPRDYEVHNGAKLYKEYECNIIIAIGGGSVMDCAKGIGIIVSNGGEIHNFEGVDKI